MINIGGDSNDASYRYKMPRLVTKIEGRGNGIKTVIVNMSSIAKALHVQTAYPTKFFGFELGAQSKYNEATDRAIVNGSHNAGDLATTLNKFIERYVLCPRCKYPELKHDIQVRKGRIEIDCAACGHNGDLNWNHRLVTFIFKDKDQKKKLKKKDKGKKDKRKKDTAAETTRAQIVRKPEKETEWFMDSSKEAQQKRKAEEFAELGANTSSSVILTKLSLKDETPVNILKFFLDSHKDCTIDDIASEVRRLQLSRGLDEPQKVKVLLEAVIDTSEPKKVPSEYKKHAAVLSKFAGEKAAKTLLIYCIEDQIGVQKPELMVRMPMILQELYDCDVLDEESIIEWAQSAPEASWMVPKDTAEKCRLKAKPFVDWLLEAPEESSEEE